MSALSVDLCSVPADFGRGANDGAYYPVGLLTVASYLRRHVPSVNVGVVDVHHRADFCPRAEIVGISASSTLNYRNVLRLARKAKDAGSLVVLGGPHVTQLTEQVLTNRDGLVDYVIRGDGEIAFASLVECLRSRGDVSRIPNLSWRNTLGAVVHNPAGSALWRYDDFQPLDLSLLDCGIEPYWAAFQSRIGPFVNAAFAVFTHFGCGYRERMKLATRNKERIGSWCSYCSLKDALFARRGKAIVAEALGLLRASDVPKGSNVLLKCYGDNVGTQQAMLNDLASAIEESDEWHEYRIGWTFYCQSSRLSPQMADLLMRVGTRNVYIGFDSADDDIQRLNGLGTSLKAHRRAVTLCQERGMKIQAGFVLGCAGETPRSLTNTLRFAEEMANQRVLERINAAVLFIVPDAPAYNSLIEREPWIRALDELPTETLQWHWVRHFCPSLGRTPTEGLEILKRAANRLDSLSPGPHASMGFISDRLGATRLVAQTAQA